LDKGGHVNDYGDFGATPYNITLVIPDIINWLHEAPGYEHNYVYTTMVSKYATEEQAKSVALRFLIHYVGDIHQPLHCATLLDSTHPTGDRGGNNIVLKPQG
jgi:hypothetical protein